MIAPSGWVLEEDPGSIAEEAGIASVAFLAPGSGADGFAENLNVISEDTGNLSLDEYVRRSEKMAPVIVSGYEVLEEGPSSVRSGTSWLWHYRGRVSGHGLEFLAMTTVKNGRAWTITYTAEPNSYDHYASDALAAMLSFEAA